MLQAMTKDGKRITLAFLPRKTLRKLRQIKPVLYCPVCKEKVVMKIGEKVIPHFAHQRKGNCPSFESGEGLYHEQGKLLLYRWLKKQKLNVQLEAYIPNIQQRPDLLLQIRDRKIALEYQCSRVPVKEVLKRNEGYLSIGITPYWILGANRMYRLSEYLWKIDTFTSQFIQQYPRNSPLNITYFCPQRLQFIQIHHLYFSQTNRAVGKITIHSLSNSSFKHLFSSPAFSKGEFLRQWNKEKLRFRMRPRGNLYGKELRWHQWLYQKGVHFEQLPSIIHLPIRSQIWMKVPPWDWQSRIYFDVLQNCRVGNTFSLKHCESILRPYIHPFHSFPLIRGKGNPIREYLTYLEQLHIIEKQSSTAFMKIRDVFLHETLEEAISGDRLIMKKLMNMQTGSL